MSEAQENAPHYDASDITVLEGLEAVRKRPGMYIGSTGERGLHHLVYEIVDNSVDEALAGYASEITVDVLEDGGVRVIDDGRGIPVAMHPTEKKPAVELVLTVLHAGGKFGGGGYAVSGGLHGVGSSVVNALSKRLEVEIKRDGHVWRQQYTHGVPNAPLEKGEETTETGTSVTFWADGDIFETTEYEFETLRKRFQQMAFLNKGLKITLTDHRPVEDPVDDDLPDLDNLDQDVDENDGINDAARPTEAGADTAEKPKTKSVTFLYEQGLEDFVKYINKQKRAEVIHR